MKRFMYLSIGVLSLMLAVAVGYHVGSPPVQAQTANWYRMVIDPNTAHTHHYVMTAEGNVFHRANYLGQPFTDDLVFVGNFWQEPPVATDQGTWGGVKGKYNDND